MVKPQKPVTFDPGNTKAYVINLDESRDRWIQCFRKLALFLPAVRIHRVAAIDGRTFADSSRPSRWKPAMLRQMRSEGFLAKDSFLDPIRTALCLSHQRALRQFLHEREFEASDRQWALILEDDAQPAEELMSRTSDLFDFDVPPDAELLFLHDRVLTEGARATACGSKGVEWCHVTGGVGLEAYLVSAKGAQKMLQAWKPLHVECDLQLMTFVSHYADEVSRRSVWNAMDDAPGGKKPDEASSLIHCFAPQRPLFQVNESLPSIKLQLLANVMSSASQAAVPSMLKLDRNQPIAFASCWFNPCRYRSRLENLLRFLDGVEGVNLLVVELAFNEDEWQLPDTLPNLVRLRTNTLCWQKEALLNHGLALLDRANFPFIGWLDADITFQNSDWQHRILDTLENKRLCQVFETADMCFPDRGPERIVGAAASWTSQARHPVHCQVSGFGWAMHREVWAKAKLFDLNIVGGGDGTMWRSSFYDYLCEKRLFSVGPNSEGFAAARRSWAKEWSSSIGMKIGYANKVRINSLPHGRGEDRQYVTRQKRLVEHVFDPRTHVIRDSDGLLQWRADTPTPLRNTVADYFASRREDHRA